MRSGLAAIMAWALLSLLACAGEPAAPVIVAPPPSDKTRLYVYRDASTYGSQEWTAVSLSGMKIGDTAPGTVFYRDVTPGTYEVEVRSESPYPNQFPTARFAAGSTIFVKIEDHRGYSNSGFGVTRPTFSAIIADPTIAAAEIKLLRLVPG